MDIEKTLDVEEKIAKKLDELIEKCERAEVENKDEEEEIAFNLFGEFLLAVIDGAPLSSLICIQSGIEHSNPETCLVVDRWVNAVSTMYDAIGAENTGKVILSINDNIKEMIKEKVREEIKEIIDKLKEN